MAIIQCKMCGGRIELSDDVTSGECPYCGSVTTFPMLNTEQREHLYSRAEHFRQTNNFDKAVSAYEAILNLDSEDPEAYWGLVLSRFGIEYVEDPTTHERVPTCHRAQFDSILADPDYLNALKYSFGCDRDIYEKEANRIAEIQKNILRVSAQEKPYDVFICYKEATDAGTRTKDSTLAQDIYYRLTNHGLKVFFSRITLEDKLGQQYEPYIFAALNSAKVMLVIGTKKEYFEAVWVKNEWSRFLALMKKDRSKLLIPCYRDMDIYDIPEELSMFQCQDMEKIGFIQDLLHGIMKVVNAQNKTADQVSSASSLLPQEESQVLSSSSDNTETNNKGKDAEFYKKVLLSNKKHLACILSMFILFLLSSHAYFLVWGIRTTLFFFSVISIAFQLKSKKISLGTRIILSVVFFVFLYMISCKPCSGTGVITCPQCGGKGETPGILWGTNTCSNCDGYGGIICPRCNGEGW